MIELRFKLKKDISTDTKKVVIMFIENWIYSIVNDTDVKIPAPIENTLTIQLKHHEDAIAIQLHGVPHDLSKFVESYKMDQETV